MTQQLSNQKKQPLTTKQFFDKEGVRSKFNELLGKKAQGFITSILQVVSSNSYLQSASPESIYNAAAMAATLDLPINQNLGYAYIVPYKGSAQFQMGWKGYVQLAQRSGQFKTMNSIEVFENQINTIDYLTGETTLKNEPPKGKVIGYIAYFKLLNGFEKSLYMSKEQVDVHAKKYSQSYKKGTSSVWGDGEDGFNAMAKKTVLKLLLAKYAPLSIEMQKAVVVDQSVVLNDSGTELEYVDNPEIIEETAEEKKEALRNNNPGKQAELLP